MKIAIFHNALDNIGGAEIVGLTLARELKADIYSTNIDHDKIQKMGFSNINIKSIGKIPLNAPLRQQAALARFRHLNLGKKYDFYIIDGDWAISAAVNHKPNLWYVHSPIREIWDLYEYTRQHSVPFELRWIFDAWVRINRHLNRKYVTHVNQLACNSLNTQNRVKTYLGREATIIHPPIETTKFHYQRNGDFWLSVNRLITHKRVDLQLEAFRQLPNERLMIVGSYEQSRHFKRYADYIKNMKPNNVEIRSWVSHAELIDLYANCKGFITTAKDEDFGMTAVEAMAAGKSVIAVNEGGYRETVIAGKTGELIDHIEVPKLIQAIQKIGKNPEIYKSACLAQAQYFDTKIFITAIQNLIDKKPAPSSAIKYKPTEIYR